MSEIRYRVRGMEQALSAGVDAYLAEYLPIGVSIYDGDVWLGNAYNKTEYDKSGGEHSHSHPEWILMEEISKLEARNGSLEGCVIYTTLEPCFDCLKRMNELHVEAVYYGIADPIMGGSKDFANMRQSKSNTGRERYFHISGNHMGDEILPKFQNFFRYIRVPYWYSPENALRKSVLSV